jgi:hypothetical protein
MYSIVTWHLDSIEAHDFELSYHSCRNCLISYTVSLDVYTLVLHHCHVRYHCALQVFICKCIYHWLSINKQRVNTIVNKVQSIEKQIAILNCLLAFTISLYADNGLRIHGKKWKHINPKMNAFMMHNTWNYLVLVQEYISRRPHNSIVGLSNHSKIKIWYTAISNAVIIIKSTVEEGTRDKAESGGMKMSSSHKPTCIVAWLLVNRKSW